MLRAVDGDLANQPGPGYYVTKGNWKEKTPPKFSFPKGACRETTKGRLEPGPGAYVVPSSVGKQVLSTSKTIPRVGFGNGERPALLRVSNDVGPGEYGRGIAACTAQIDSRKLTAGYVKFGTAPRTHETSVAAQDDERSRPGPGTYKLPSGLGGNGAAYPFRAAPKCSMSGREKFGSPFKLL